MDDTIHCHMIMVSAFTYKYIFLHKSFLEALSIMLPIFDTAYKRNINGLLIVSVKTL